MSETKTLEQFASTPKSNGQYPTDAECDAFEVKLNTTDTLNPAAEQVSLRELCEHAELEPQQYSGRGMMGRQCLGVQCDSIVSFVSSLLTAARECCSSYEQLEMTLEGIEDALGQMRTDSMGRNIILYFPGLPFEDSDGDDSDDD